MNGPISKIARKQIDGLLGMHANQYLTNEPGILVEHRPCGSDGTCRMKHAGGKLHFWTYDHEKYVRVFCRGKDEPS